MTETCLSVSSLESCSEKVFGKHSGVSVGGAHVANLALMDDTSSYSIYKHKSQCGSIVKVLGCDGEHVGVQVFVKKRALLPKGSWQYLSMLCSQRSRGVLSPDINNLFLVSDLKLPHTLTSQVFLVDRKPCDSVRLNL